MFTTETIVRTTPGNWPDDGEAETDCAILRPSQHQLIPTSTITTTNVLQHKLMYINIMTSVQTHKKTSKQLQGDSKNEILMIKFQLMLLIITHIVLTNQMSKSRMLDIFPRLA